MQCYMQKKRKFQGDPELDKSLYSTFTQAANAITLLYAQAGQQAQRMASEAKRETLEKLWEFIVTKSAGSDVISVQDLQHFLQAEYQDCSLDGAIAEPNPNTMLPDASMPSSGSQRRQRHVPTGRRQATDHFKTAAHVPGMAAAFQPHAECDPHQANTPGQQDIAIVTHGDGHVGDSPWPTALAASPDEHDMTGSRLLSMQDDHQMGMTSHGHRL